MVPVVYTTRAITNQTTADLCCCQVAAAPALRQRRPARSVLWTSFRQSGQRLSTPIALETDQLQQGAAQAPACQSQPLQPGPARIRQLAWCQPEHTYNCSYHDRNNSARYAQAQHHSLKAERGQSNYRITFSKQIRFETGVVSDALPLRCSRR